MRTTSTFRGLLVNGLAALSSTLSAACSPAPPATPHDDPPPIEGHDGAAEPSSAEVGKAVELIKAEKYADAIPVLEKAVAANPKDGQAHFYLAVSLEGTGKKGDAETHYKAALQADPSLVDASQNLAALYLDEPPRPKDAINVLEGALKRAPGDAKLLHNLGYAKELDKDIPGAIAAYEQSLAKEETTVTHFALGNLLVEQKQFDKAVPHLRKAAEGMKDDVPTLAAIANMMGRAKAFDDCVKLLDAVIAKKADSPDFLVRRGACKHGQGKDAEAVADFDAAIKVDPKFGYAHFYRAGSLLELKKKAEAKKALQQAAELGKGTPLEQQAKEKLKDL